MGTEKKKTVKKNTDAIPAQEKAVTRVESQPSVEISRSAKGIVQLAVKVYDDDPDAAMKQATVIYDKLATKYPYTG